MPSNQTLLLSSFGWDKKFWNVTLNNLSISMKHNWKKSCNMFIKDDGAVCIKKPLKNIWHDVVVIASHCMFLTTKTEFNSYYKE